MQSLTPFPRLFVRPAQSSDLVELRRLVQVSRRVHLNLDWWRFEDWVGNPAFLIAHSGEHIAGLGMGVRDASPVAWLRALTVEDGLSADALLNAIFPSMFDALRLQRVPALVCLSWADWLSHKLSERGFRPMARVATLRKDNEAMPAYRLREVDLREARPTDLDAIISIDHAAFEAEWWYSGETFSRVLSSPAHFIVAEQNGEPAGYAIGDVLGQHAHITRLAVHPARQRRGIGAQLLQDLVTQFAASDVDTITLSTQTHNKDALRLYHRFGFKLTGDMVTVWRISLLAT